MRSKDSSLPLEEILYRSVSPSALTDGEALLPSAVDLPATSCNRQKYSDPASVLVPERPEDTLVASVRVGDLPEPMRAPDPKTETWYEFSGEDDPLPDNEAHAEVRLARRGSGYNARHKPSSPVFRMTLKTVLARCFRVITPPAPPSPPRSA